MATKTKTVKTSKTVENATAVVKAAGLPTLPQALAKKVATAITAKAAAKADPLGMEAGLKAIAAAPVVVAATVQPKGSLKDAVLAVFKDSPAKEFKTEDVVTAVQFKLPKSKKDNILWLTSQLRKENAIHRVRMDGHSFILQYGPGAASAAPVPKAVASTKAVVKAPLVDPSGDLVAVLKEMMALVEERAVIDALIAELKKLI